MAEQDVDDIPTQRDAAAWGAAGVPDVIGPYRLAEVVGWGGMGAVYAAIDERSGDRVAIKVMRTDMGADEQDRKRFHQEVEIVRELRHPGIVPVRDSGSHGALEYLVMDLIDGPTLADLLGDDEPMPWRRAVELMIRVARAVAVAHERGFVHRDLKPGNILLDEDGAPFVTDFGVARTVGMTSSLTASGTAVGTPEYMSPEQTRGHHKDCAPSSDVWSLGVLLYEMVTGVSPFRGETVLDSMARVNDVDPRSARSLVADLPPALNRIILQCLAKGAHRRYPDAAALADDLERLQRGERVSARSVSGIARWFRRLPRPLVMVVLMVGILGLASGVAWMAWERSQRGTWVEVASWDFTDPAVDLSGLRFAGGHLDQDLDPWSRGPDGLEMAFAEWLWLRDVDLPEDVRIDLVLDWTDDIDGLELCLNSRSEPQRSTGTMPVGYSCQVAGWSGLLNFISRNESDQGRHTAGARYVPTAIEDRLEVSFYRRNDRFVLDVDGRDPITEIYPLPISGEDLGGVGLKTFAHGVRLRRLSVSRYVAGSLTSPLERGDALIAAGATKTAAEEYLAIAAVHQDASIAAPALARAYLAYHDLEAADEVLASIEAQLAERYPDSAYLRLVREAQVMDAWRRGDEVEALDRFDRIFDQFGASRVLLRCLDIRRDAMEPATARRFLSALAHDRSLSALDLSGLKLTDIGPLDGLPLAWFQAKDNLIADLGPLRGMPLRFIDLASNRIADLSPLSASPVRDLNLWGNPLTSLDGLEGVGVESIWASNTDLEDIGALAGNDTLRNLGISSTAVADLSPLAAAPLENLYAGESSINDLSPLAGKRLVHVFVDSTAVRDLRPIMSPALRQLGATMIGLTSVESLSAATGLERAYLSHNEIVDCSPLAALPLLELAVVSNRIVDLAPLAALGDELGLHCHNNPVADLGWLLTDPPAGIKVPPLAGLSDDQLSDALEAWSVERPDLAMFAAAALAERRGDPSLARSHAVPIGSQRVAIVTRSVSAEQAVALAESWGGSLIGPEAADEVYALRQLYTEYDQAWCALRADDDGRVVRAGEAVDWLEAGARVDAESGALLMIDGRDGVVAGHDDSAWPAVAFPAE